MLGKDYAGQECALASALEVLGERWTLLIIRDAFFGVRRYGEWVARLDIPRAVLSERLRGLVVHGVMEKRDDPERAGRTVYELTPAGRDLWPALYALISWGSEHRRRSTNVYRHAVCGIELAAGARCPDCDVVPPADDVLLIPRGAAGARGRTDPVSVAMRRPRRLLEPVQTAGGEPVSA
jgi:DNA-binding HxlR family transcriptional regulator